MNRVVVAAVLASLVTAAIAMPFFRSEALSTRKLDDIAVIGVPTRMEESYKGHRERWIDRLVFTFGSTYTWASIGITRYKQLLTVAMISPHADDAAFKRPQGSAIVSYANRSVIHDAALGSGHLTVVKGIYELGATKKPAYGYVYIDKVKRLRLDWHAVEEEVELADGLRLIADMASSFRIVKDPVQRFATLHDRPNREANEAARRVNVAKAMLAREGFKHLVPSKAQQMGEMYVEWMAEPEARYQLLVPLGRVRAATPDGGPAPRPNAFRAPDGSVRDMPGTLGWYAMTDEGWKFGNNANAYYPFQGIQAVLQAQHTSPAEVLYYYVATVRVEEMESDEPTLTGIGWFAKTIPEVQQLWREGKLVQGTIIPGSPR